MKCLLRDLEIKFETPVEPFQPGNFMQVDLRTGFGGDGEMASDNLTAAIALMWLGTVA